MKKSMLLIATLFICMAATAKVTVTAVLGTMPERLVHYIDNDRRDEIGKFSSENDSLEIKNSLSGTTRIRTISDDFALVELSESSTLQVKLLSVGDTVQVICIVKTITSPVPESEVKFYTIGWDEIDDNFGLPDTHDAAAMLSSLAVRPDTMTETRFGELLRYIEPIVVSVGFDAKGDTLTFGLGVPFTTEQVRDDVKAIIKQKSFKWDGKTFRMC